MSTYTNRRCISLSSALVVFGFFSLIGCQISQTPISADETNEGQKGELLASFSNQQIQGIHWSEKTGDLIVWTNSNVFNVTATSGEYRVIAGPTNPVGPQFREIRNVNVIKGTDTLYYLLPDIGVLRTTFLGTKVDTILPGVDILDFCVSPNQRYVALSRRSANPTIHDGRLRVADIVEGTEKIYSTFPFPYDTLSFSYEWDSLPGLSALMFSPQSDSVLGIYDYRYYSVDLASGADKQQIQTIELGGPVMGVGWDSDGIYHFSSNSNQGESPDSLYLHRSQNSSQRWVYPLTTPENNYYDRVTAAQLFDNGAFVVFTHIVHATKADYYYGQDSQTAWVMIRVYTAATNTVQLYAWFKEENWWREESDVAAIVMSPNRDQVAYSQSSSLYLLSLDNPIQ